MCLAACTTAQNAEQAGDGTKQQSKKPVVYFTRDLSAEGLKKVYSKINQNLTGKVASLAKERGVKLASPLMGQKYVPGQTPTRAWWEEVK